MATETIKTREFDGYQVLAKGAGHSPDPVVYERDAAAERKVASLRAQGVACHLLYRGRFCALKYIVIE